MRFHVAPLLLGCALGLQGCHHKVASVLPKGGNSYEVIGQSATEQQAYMNAEAEGKYTCKKLDKEMIVVDQRSVYQGADKNSKGDVRGSNVALAFVTGRSGKERDADDYKVTLTIDCR